MGKPEMQISADRSEMRINLALICISGTDLGALRFDPHASAFQTNPQIISTDLHFRLALLLLTTRVH